MSTVVANSGGPGSSITLDPEIVSMRDRYLKALEGKPFDEMNLLIQKQLETEEGDIKRLSLLAARVYILRLRTLELRDEPTEHAMPWSKAPEENKKKDKNTEGAEEKNSENKDNEWRRLRMIEAGEVNGVRFPPGIIIDVNAEDGEKLVESKKAEYVNVDKSDENPETEENKVDDGDKFTSDATEDRGGFFNTTGIGAGLAAFGGRKLASLGAKSQQRIAGVATGIAGGLSAISSARNIGSRAISGGVAARIASKIF